MARAQAPVHGVAVQIRAAPPAPGAEALGEHVHHGVELRARERAIGPGPATEREQPVFVPLAAGHLGDDLLRQHVERLVRDDEPVELAAAHGVEQRRALHQLVAAQGKQPAPGNPGDGVIGPADALQENGDGARRAELAHQVHVSDIDAELERGGHHQRAQPPGLEPLLGLEAAFLRQAAVMGADVVLTQTLAQVARHALGQAACCDAVGAANARANQRATTG